VWPDLATTTAARDRVRSICLHARKIRKVLTTTASDELETRRRGLVMTQGRS
jgi:hypothetical protein